MIMSLDNTTPPIQPYKDETQTYIGCATTGVEKTSTLKPPEEILKCPRCDSPNTKFCYYNNYCLTQPRHFCKTCRRYWTKGGALRKVPIGGGCRKKKTKSSSSRGLSSSEIERMNLFTGLPPPAMDFQLNGLNQFSSASSINLPPFMNLDSLRIKFSLVNQDYSHQIHGGLASFQEFGITNNIDSSIESLSSINQDLHRKLHQQRLSPFFSGVGGETKQQNHIVLDSQAQKLQPVIFQNLETSKPSQPEWFFNGNYAHVNVDQAQIHGVAQGNGDTVGNYESGNMNNWNDEIQGWNDFNALP